MTPLVSPTLAVVSAIVAVGSLLLYLHSTWRSDKDSARDEALALAETRRQLIADLRAALHEAQAEARNDLRIVRAHLERTPPDVDGALVHRPAARPRASLAPCVHLTGCARELSCVVQGARPAGRASSLSPKPGLDWDPCLQGAPCLAP